jgi:peptide deformylase
MAGDEILSKKSKLVEIIDVKVKELVKDMIDTLHEYNGVGLAAVQVGILKKIVVIDIYEEETPIFVLINPEIIEEEGTQEVEEGCLSFPNKFGKIVRPAKVTVTALNEEGENIKLEATELLAQAIAHEIDHLNGEVFVDKVIKGTLMTVTEDEKEKKI